MKLLWVSVLVVVLAVVTGCHKKPVEVEKKPPVPAEEVAKEDVSEKRAVKKPALPDKNILFTIKRSENRNEVIYEARLTPGGFDIEDPINVYWIMYEQGAKTEVLNTIERKSAYGISIDSATEEKVVFNLKALKDRRIEAIFDKESKRSKAVMPINGERCELENVYINAKNRKLNPIPKVLNIDISGRSLETDKKVKEVITP